MAVTRVRSLQEKKRRAARLARAKRIVALFGPNAPDAVKKISRSRKAKKSHKRAASGSGAHRSTGTGSRPKLKGARRVGNR